MKVTIQEVVTRKDLKAFVHYPNELYKDNKYYVPTLESGDRDTLDPKKNHAFEFCEGKYWLARDEKGAQEVDEERRPQPGGHDGRRVGADAVEGGMAQRGHPHEARQQVERERQHAVAAAVDHDVGDIPFVHDGRYGDEHRQEAHCDDRLVLGVELHDDRHADLRLRPDDERLFSCFLHARLLIPCSFPSVPRSRADG